MAIVLFKYSVLSFFRDERGRLDLTRCADFALATGELGSGEWKRIWSSAYIII